MKFRVVWSKTYYASGIEEVEAKSKKEAENIIKDQIGNLGGSMQYAGDEDQVEAHIVSDVERKGEKCTSPFIIGKRWALWDQEAKEFGIFEGNSDKSLPVIYLSRKLAEKDLIDYALTLNESRKEGRMGGEFFQIPGNMSIAMAEWITKQCVIELCDEDLTRLKKAYGGVIEEGTEQDWHCFTRGHIWERVEGENDEPGNPAPPPFSFYCTHCEEEEEGHD